MQEATRFIQDNFKQIAVLKESGNSLTELVMDQDKTIFVRKTIPYTGLPYQKLMQLSHSMLPKVFYAAEGEGKTFVIEQHIDGQNLQEVLEHKGSLPEQQVQNIALQLCDGLEYLHEHNIIHRDIKPSNVIIQKNGAVRLIDFGAARVLRAKSEHAGAENAKGADEANIIQEQDTRILGTPGYAPPEQYGFAPTDYRSDYYALGMTLQTLLGKEYKGTLTKAIRRCVELDPERRIQTVAELRNLLQAHWYDAVAEYKTVIALLLCVLLGGAAWWMTSGGNRAATEKAALPSTTVMTQEKKNEIKQQPVAAQNEKENAEIKKGNSKEVTQTQAKTSKENLQKPKEILSKNVTETQPSTGAVPKTAAVEFIGNNWSNFQKTEQHLGPQVAGADKAVPPAGKLPQVVLTNNSNTELKNPKVELYFTDFGVVGSNFSAEAWGGRAASTMYANKNAKGVSQQVTLKLSGTLPAHEWHRLSLFGVSGYYKTGANPSVRMVFSADNAPAQEKSYTIEVK